MGNNVIPIEVKSGARGTLKSLHQFMFDKKLPQALRFDLNRASSDQVKVRTTKGDDVQYELVSLPLYLAEFFRDFIGLSKSDFV